MKVNNSYFQLAFLLIFACFLFACSSGTAEKIDLTSDIDRAGYAVGVQFGNQLKNIKYDHDMDQIKKGLVDLLTGAEMAYTDEELRKAFTSMMAKSQQNAPDSIKNAIPEPIEIKQACYAVGANIARNLKGINFDHNVDAIIKGMKEAMAGTEIAMTPEELQTAFTDMMRSSVEKTEKAAEEKALADPKAVENKKAGEDFLAENAKKEGVVSLPSGVQYKVLKEGKGDPLGNSGKVMAHYTLAFLDGKVWQSSYTANKPFPVDLARPAVIDGWKEILPMMNVGAKWKVFVPYHKGYKAAGSPPSIPAFQALIFEVEIVEKVQ